jgi:hypothetical protein
VKFYCRCSHRKHRYTFIMKLISVAQIRFRKGGRLYPVNCPNIRFEPGDRVIVRMVGQAETLQPAEIVRTALSKQKKPYRNSVVCRESEAHEYGNGPQGIDSVEDLHRFLTHLGWTKFSCLHDIGHFEPPKPLDDWPIAYALGWFHPWRGAPPPENPTKFHLFCERTFYFGQQGVGFKSHSVDVDGNLWPIPLIDGKLLLGSYPSISRIEVDSNPYRHVAEWVELDRIFEYRDDSPDTSLAEIRRAISADGGPAYLGDDVWI